MGSGRAGDEDANPAEPTQSLLSKPRLSLQALRGKGKGGEGHIKHQDHDHSGEPRGSSIGRRRRASSMSAKANRLVSCLKGNALTLATVSGVLSGIALGFILRASREESWTPREIMYVSYVGEIFLRSLRCLILPLIVSSIISAVGGLELGMSSRIAFRAVVYYMTTTILAVILGIILVTSIHPGVAGAQDVPREGEARNVTTADTLMDLIRNLFPPNLVQACIYSYRTVLTPPTAGSQSTTTSPEIEGSDYDYYNTATEVPNKRPNLYEWNISSEYQEGTNIMGMVVFAFVLGITLCKMGEKGKPLYDFFSTLADAMMTITNWVIWLSPVGVLFLITGQLLVMKDFRIIVGSLGMYFITVLVGIFIHGFIVLPIIYVAITRTFPFRFLLNMTDALSTAFGTSSSSATLPVTFRCLEGKNHIDQRISRFVLPIGATINMDGTALYEAVAAIFIAQVRGVSLGIGSVIAISITSTAASIGAAGIPQAGLVTLVMVLDTVGLPPEDVTLIVAVDWLLDRFRTTINVWGDCLGAAIVAHLSQKELSKTPMPEATTMDPNDIEMGGTDPESWDKVNGDKLNTITAKGGPEDPAESTAI